MKLFFVFLFVSIAPSMNPVPKPGFTRYESHNEYLQLFDNNKFEYGYNAHTARFRVDGYWIQFGDSLILNSTPQRDRIIVRESRDSSSLEYFFDVKTKQGASINYSLSIFDVTGKEMEFKYQSDSTHFQVNERMIKSFTITLSHGVRTPRYYIIGQWTNRFDIQVEPLIVFEEETWVLKGDTLFPQDVFAGGFSPKHFLVKQ